MATATLITITTPAPVQCQVCFEDVSQMETVKLEACAHVCCRSCLQQHVTAKISSGELRPTCFFVQNSTNPASQICAGVISEREIEELLDATMLRKYHRFQFNARHPVFGRQCPHCDHSQVFPGGDKQADCICANCGREFCFRHGAAHLGRTCEDYDEVVKQVEMVTSTTLRRTTKKCPGCLVAIEKNGGCNHMTCLKCGASFCWLCLAFIEETSTPDHYKPWSMSSCAGLQIAETNSVSWIHRFGRLVIRGIVSGVVAVPALAVTASLTLLTFGWYPFRVAYGASAWDCTKVCFFFSWLSIFNTLDEIRHEVVERLGAAFARTPSTP